MLGCQIGVPWQSRVAQVRVLVGNIGIFPQILKNALNFLVAKSGSQQPKSGSQRPSNFQVIYGLPLIHSLFWLKSEEWHLVNYITIQRRLTCRLSQKNYLQYDKLFHFVKRKLIRYTYTFSSTIPLAWEAPPKGLAFHLVPKWDFL